MSRLSRSVACAALVLVLGSLYGLGAEPISHDIRPGLGVTELRWLSDYHPELRDTPGDTPIYVLQGDEPGGTFLFLGGTHANEIGGIMAATLFVERAEVSKGTVFVIPHANNSASRFNDGTYNETSPQWFELTTASGEVRSFRYGGRRTQLEDQVPDPEVFVHYPSGIEFAGNEARNLNRNHPGKADGTLTQQISYALFQLAEQEGIDVIVDMHESSITSRLAHMIVCHPRSLEIGAMATLDLEWAGIVMKLEVSQEEYHGLSHREFGDYTDAYVFLVETPNPGQERSIENPDVVNDPAAPLSGRVRTHLATVAALIENYSLVVGPEREIGYAFPFDLDELVGANLGDYLR